MQQSFVENELGEYGLIGAGASVTKSVLAYALVLGNPAKASWMGK